MRIQAKLFLLLLVIAILPLAALSWRSERATEDLGQAIADHGKAAMITEIEGQLRQAVGYSSELLAAQQRQVELALRLQAAAVERLLAAPLTSDSADAPIYMHSEFDGSNSWPPGTELALDHATLSQGRDRQAVPISRDHQSFLLTADADPAAAREVMRRLVPLDGTYKRLNAQNSKLFYWQYVALENGVHSAFPGHGSYPAGYDPRDRAWYKAAKQAALETPAGTPPGTAPGSAMASDNVAWTPAQIDASTRRLLLTAGLAVRGPAQAVSGVTGIDVDILDVLSAVHGRLRLGPTAESFVVQLDETQPPARRNLRVVAASSYRDSGSAWDTVPETPILESGTPAGLAALIDDLGAGRDGIQQMPHRERDALWVYGPVEGLNAALLFIVPMDDVESIADQAQASVRQAIVDQVNRAGIATVALTILVAVLSMVAARSVTERLRLLAGAAQGLAKGDFETRVDIAGADEVGDLARSFNTMVPELRQHIHVKESLTLAREVQQKLLPASAPKVPGFDIAGRCLYSEGVGGDYYDFMEMSDAAGDRRLGITVADVAGHGIVAALTMTSVRVLLRSHAGDGAVLKPVIRAVNRHLAADATAGRFVTLVYLVIEPDTREVRWINAGHGSLLLYDPGADSFEEIEGADIPLGVEADWNFHERLRSSWPASAILAIGTDGIWETHNPEGKAFGGARFREVIRTAAQLPAEQICAALVRRLKAFADGTPQRDDVTLVIIKFPTEI